MKNWLLLSVIVVLHVGSFNLIHAQVGSGILGSSDAIVYDVRLIPGTDNLIANLGDKVQVWNYKTQLMISSWPSSQTVSISYFDNKVAGVSKSGNVAVWNLSDGKQLFDIKVVESPLICVAWLDAEHLVVGSEKGDLVKVNINSASTIARTDHFAPITALAATGSRILAGDAKGNLNIYDIKDMTIQSARKAHKDWIREIKVSENGEGFVTSSDDGSYSTWRAGKDVSTIKKRSLGNWVLSADIISSSTGDIDFFAFGKSNGGVIVDVNIATYTTKLNSMVNSVAIIGSELPQIVLALGTHGQGIQILSAKNMKLNKSK